VWEGLRVYTNGIFALDYHLDRLFASAHAMAFANASRSIEPFTRNPLVLSIESSDGLSADCLSNSALIASTICSSSIGPSYLPQQKPSCDCQQRHDCDGDHDDRRRFITFVIRLSEFHLINPQADVRFAR